MIQSMDMQSSFLDLDVGTFLGDILDFVVFED